MRPRRHRDRQAGFSLPELMVVLSIIMLLVTLAVPRLRRAKQHAEEAAARTTMYNIHTAQEAQRIMMGSYAPTFKTLQQEGGQPLASPGSDTGTGSSGEDVMVFEGYIFRLNRTAPDEYTVTAEPIEDRIGRPSYSMNQFGAVATSDKPPAPPVGATPKKPPEPPP